MIEATFFISVFIILYTYILYPIILSIIGSLKKNPPSPPAEFNQNYEPFISLIISAHNEEAIIEKKIKNLLKLNYPHSKTEILIGSDGSIDNTNKICSLYHKKNIYFFTFSKRRGKAAVLNDLIQQSKGELIIFSDANTMLKPCAIKMLVKHFQNKKIGGVSGQLKLECKDSLKVVEAIYQQYETLLKQLESKVLSIIGAFGGIYAIRKELFTQLPHSIIIDDFFISMHIIGKGYIFTFEKGAIGYEETSNSLKTLFKRKIRIGAGNIQSLKHTYPLLMPQKGLIAFMFWSHKLLRWSIPILLIILYLIPYIAKGYSFHLLLILENLILIFAIIGMLFWEKIKIFTLITYFFVINCALLCGYFQYIFGMQKGIWEKNR